MCGVYGSALDTAMAVAAWQVQQPCLRCGAPFVQDQATGLWRWTCTCRVPFEEALARWRAQGQ